MTDSSTLAKRWTYSGLSRTGASERGTVVADSSSDALRELSARGIAVERLREGRVGRPRAIPAGELATGLSIIADLLDAGLPMNRALAAFEAMASHRWRAGLPALRRHITEGMPFGRALEQSHLGIAADVWGIVSAGDAGLGLVPAIRNAAAVSRRQDETRSAIAQALAYPITLALAGTTTVTILVTLVLPRFAAILTDLGQELPASTRFVLAAGDVVRRGGIAGVAVAILLGVAWRVATSTPSGRRAWHDSLLTLPLVGNIRLASASARWTVVAAGLLETGVPLAAAMHTAAAAAGDAAIEQRILAARLAVTHGERPSAAVAGTRAASETAVRLIQAGEASGRMAMMLAHAAKLDQDEVTRRIRAIVRLVEPAMIVAFGAIVALVAASLLQALYGVRPR